MLCEFVEQEGKYLCKVCGLELPPGLTSAYAVCGSAPKPSPIRCGDELHAILSDWLGVTPSPTCPCRSMSSRMNMLGPDWCQSPNGMREILDVMRAEHSKRWSAGEIWIPWSDFFATRLVLLACRRAKAKAAC